MATYTVHLPELSTGDDIRDRERILFVRDGFSILALAFPALWLLFNRLWIPLGGYLLLALVLTLTLPDHIAGILMTAFNVLLAFEGDMLRRLILGWQGYRMVDVVVGVNQEDCERRFFDRFDGQVGLRSDPNPAPSANSAAVSKPSVSGPNRGSEQVIGSF